MSKKGKENSDTTSPTSSSDGLKRCPDTTRSASASDKLYDYSTVTTPEELALFQEAGKLVGLRVDQVSIVLDSTGKTILLQEGEVGMRYQTGDAELIDKFHTTLAELKAKALQAAQAQG
jgi:hypothetical protein